MSHKFDECVEVGHHIPIVVDQANTEDFVEGHIECEVCGAVTDNFEFDWLIHDKETDDYKSISGILEKEEEEETKAIDNDRIKAGLK